MLYSRFEEVPPQLDASKLCRALNYYGPLNFGIGQVVG